ncbi:hypothetical protein [Nocardioides furvisabuli]|nr:hypothetical protein [Nocardioides furvisabuli]
MRKAAASLRRMNDGSTYRSEAIDAVRRNADDLALVMDDSRARFHEAGQALVEYAPKLDAAQQRALRAINANGHTDVTGTAGKAATLKAAAIASAANPLATPEERTAADLAYQRAKSRAIEHAAAAAAARGEYDQARADVDRAALEAMNRISAANKRGKLNDGVGDHLANFNEKVMKPLLEMLVFIVDAVAAILLAVAAVLALLGVTAPIAAFVAGALTVVALVSIGLKVVQLGLSHISMGEFVASALMFGAGKIASKLAKGAKATRGLHASEVHKRPTQMSAPRKGKVDLVDLPDAGGSTAESVIDFFAGDWLADQVDSVVGELVEPGSVWSVDDLRTTGVEPLGGTGSSVEPQAIIDNHFGPDAALDRPLAACAEGGS